MVAWGKLYMVGAELVHYWLLQNPCVQGIQVGKLAFGPCQPFSPCIFYICCSFQWQSTIGSRDLHLLAWTVIPLQVCLSVCLDACTCVMHLSFPLWLLRICTGSDGIQFPEGFFPFPSIPSITRGRPPFQLPTSVLRRSAQLTASLLLSSLTFSWCNLGRWGGSIEDKTMPHCLLCPCLFPPYSKEHSMASTSFLTIKRNRGPDHHE